MFAGSDPRPRAGGGGGPDQAGKGHRRPVGEEVCRDVAGTAEACADRAVLQDRDRRLRRYARHLAIDEAIEQNIAHDEDVRLYEAVDDAGIHGSRDWLPHIALRGVAPVSSGGITPAGAIGYRFAAFSRSRGLHSPAVAPAEAAISVLGARGKVRLCGRGDRVPAHAPIAARRRSAEADPAAVVTGQPGRRPPCES